MRCKSCASRRSCQIAALINTAPATIRVEDCKNYIAEFCQEPKNSRRHNNPQPKDLSHRSSRIRALSPMQTAGFKAEPITRYCAACGNETQAGEFVSCDRCHAFFCEICITTEATSKAQYCSGCWEKTDPSTFETKGSTSWN